MSAGTVRCPRCNLLQLGRGACSRCGTPLVAAGRGPRGRQDGTSWLRLFLDVWFSPRQAIRQIVGIDAARGVIALTWCVGVGLLLSGIAPKTSDRFPLPFAVAMAVFVGPLMSFAVVFLAALFTAGTGRLLGGGSTPGELRAVFAWSQVPSLLCLLLWVPMTLGTAPFRLAADALHAVVLVWSEILAVAMAAEVLGISTFRATVAVLLSWMIKVGLLVALLFAAVPDPGAGAS